jgi:putative YhdH/YhfP family quinone oxidoreductase
MKSEYKALYISETPEGNFIQEISTLTTDQLTDKGILIRVLFSSLNYKDALSASGNKGVTRRYPHTPGIDAAGIVAKSNHPDIKEGDEVIVTGYDLGMNTFGGFGEYINVPDSWIVPKPTGMSFKECMTLGTAGFTAALAVHHLLRSGQRKENGPVLVTGATGGVGSWGITLLSHLGFEVIAASGKPEQTDFLRKLGAKTVIGRSETDDMSGKALLRPKWAGAIDTVGGNILATVLKSCSEHGNIAVCGNVASPQLNTTVFPFILNGVNLLGVNSATTPMELRRTLWQKLNEEWKTSLPDDAVIETDLMGLPEYIRQILTGRITGRVVLKHSS